MLKLSLQTKSKKVNIVKNNDKIVVKKNTRHVPTIRVKKLQTIN
jgi:hypothetical protein